MEGEADFEPFRWKKYRYIHPLISIWLEIAGLVVGNTVILSQRGTPSTLAVKIPFILFSD
jgi:hypothetical protein